MKPLSAKIAGVTESATIAISNKAKAMQRQGIDVISLSIGEPDFATPQHITDACIDALKRGETHYAPSSGIPELTAAIAEKIERENHFPCTPQQVIVACGAKDAIYEACEAVLNPGDEAIILTPAWVSYEPCIHIAGGKTVFHEINQKTFQLDDSLLEKVNNKTKMIIVNSPSNPTGAVFNKKSMQLVADLCTDKDLYAMSDEIYEKMIYGKEHLSLAAIGDMHERTITINGFSKAYAMTGWRLGYAVGPKQIITEMSKVQQHSISQVTTFAMWGGVAALKGDQQCVENMRQEFDKRRKYVMGELKAMGYETAPAEGAFYAFVKVAGNDMEVASRWLDKGHVAATPGSAFYASGWIRLSYAASMEKLKEAMARIKRVG
ncbi:pyridoxal phosphate-dependent aminotransferase [Methanoregula formicica]|uniref:Aminotransferase n=1 Tax=Methanoregula formicica (strain DSM 22288 / NBRC 105244 / SMSP) TaxID=593750 RepID=L0H906_METFS|nr:pyridoxal phosphate-dependent aminotransferase [Methanoregula formicica]AGB01197.1 aspartate/tyrosine/aromatic aminotransferase [Methanoregula formicica SMSP]